MPPVLAPIIDYRLHRLSAANVFHAIKLTSVLSDKDKDSASYSVIAFGHLRNDETQRVAVKAFPICIRNDSVEEQGMYIGGTARLLYEQTVYAYLTEYVPDYMKQHFVNLVMAGYSVNENVAADPHNNITMRQMGDLLLGGKPLPWDDTALREELFQRTYHLAGEMIPPRENGRIVGVAMTVTTKRDSKSLQQIGSDLSIEYLRTLGNQFFLHAFLLKSLNTLRSLLAQALIAVFVANRLGVEHHDMHGKNVLVAEAGDDVPPLALMMPSGLRLSVPRAGYGIVTLFDWDSASCAACGPNTALNEWACPMFGMCEGATERRDVFYLLNTFNWLFNKASLKVPDNPVPNMLSGEGVPYEALFSNGYFCAPANGDLAAQPTGRLPCKSYPPGEPRNVPDVLQLLHDPFFDPFRI